MKDENKVDEMIDDASLIMSTSKAGTILASKIAKESISQTKRYRISDKIGKLLKELSD